MNIFLEEHKQIIQILLKHKVEFMLIGGYAVIFYGYRRTTGDMDLWLNPDNMNKIKLCNSLEEAGFETEDLVQLENLDFTQHQSFSIGTEPQKIDFITRVNSIEFSEANEHKVIAEIDDIKMPVIHLNDLVKTKINTGRSKDAADIEALQHLKNKRID
ncbi:MAG: hypothetical protein RL065_724 [Bacteroidota bacterium]|jgi:predicted nucleotidyltransferase